MLASMYIFSFFVYTLWRGVINGPSVDKISTLVQSGQLIQQLNFWPSSIYNLAICMTLLLISPLKPASCYQEILKTGKKDTNNIVALTKWIVIRKRVRLRLKAKVCYQCIYQPNLQLCTARIHQGVCASC